MLVVNNKYCYKCGNLLQHTTGGAICSRCSQANTGWKETFPGETLPQVTAPSPKEDMNVSNIAIRMIDLTSEVKELQISFNNLAMTFERYSTEVYKSHQEMAKRIQASEARVSELEKLVVENKSSATLYEN